MAFVNLNGTMANACLVCMFTPDNDGFVVIKPNGPRIMHVNEVFTKPHHAPLSDLKDDGLLLPLESQRIPILP